MIRRSISGCIVAALSFALPWSAWPSGSDGVPRAADRYKRDFVAVNRQIWGIGNPAFTASQIEAESAWRDGQTSSANARGLCQFIEPTALGIERQYEDIAGLARYSPAWCFRANAYLMRDEVARYKPGRGECTALLMAASAYNGGPYRLNAEIAMCREDAACDASRWFGHVDSKRSRAWWAWNENRPYVTRIYSREPAYAADGWGRLVCR